MRICLFTACLLVGTVLAACGQAAALRAVVLQAAGIETATPSPAELHRLTPSQPGAGGAPAAGQAPASALPGATPTPPYLLPLTDTLEAQASAVPPLPEAQVQPAGEELLQKLAFDLLFQTGDGLFRWSHLRRQVEPLLQLLPDGSSAGVYPGTPVEFITDGQQRRAVVLVDRRVTANGVSLYDLILIDFERAVVQLIQRETRRVQLLSFSPDGRWLAAAGDSSTARLLLYPLDDLSAPVTQIYELGSCSGSPRCAELAWQANEDTLAWTNADGVWIASAPAWEAELVQPARLPMVDRDGSTRDAQVVFGWLSWSPFGRYLQVEVSQPQAGARWLVLVDTRARTTAEIPNTLLPPGSTINAAWLPDGRLFTIYLEAGDGAQASRYNLWRVFPTRSGLLAQDTSQQVLLPADLYGNLVLIGSRYMLLSSQGQAEKSGLLARLDLAYGQPNWLVSIPAQLLAIDWAPDGSGVLLQTPGTGWLYARAGEDILYTLSGVLGDGLERIIWCRVGGALFQPAPDAEAPR